VKLFKTDNMRRYNIDTKFGNLAYLIGEFEKYKNLAKSYLEILQGTSNKYAILDSELIGNTIKFTFWGLDLTVKTEISLNVENKTFFNGELNSHIKRLDNEELLMTYKFDSIGNIGRSETDYLSDDFAKFFIVDLIVEAIEYSIKNNIKFQLK